MIAIRRRPTSARAIRIPGVVTKEWVEAEFPCQVSRSPLITWFPGEPRRWKGGWQTDDGRDFPEGNQELVPGHWVVEDPGLPGVLNVLSPEEFSEWYTLVE